MNRFAALAITAVLALGVWPATSARAADFANSYAADSGVCGEQWVLRRISRDFRYQVRHVPHLPNVEIADFDRIHLHRYLPSSEKWPIARTYCGATVLLSDGRARSIWYLIEGGMGYAGIGDGVEFCVSGFDRWMVYNGRCRVLR